MRVAAGAGLGVRFLVELSAYASSAAAFALVALADTLLIRLAGPEHSGVFAGRLARQPR